MITSNPVRQPRFVMTSPFTGNNRIQMAGVNGLPPHVNPPDVRQCVMCCGFIVRAGSGTRRSTRVKDLKIGTKKLREHVELDSSGKRAVPNVCRQVDGIEYWIP